MNQKVFKQFSIIFNLTKTEADILLFLSELRSSWPVSGIGRELGIPRQTVHSNLKKLAKRGFVIETIEKKEHKKTSFFRFSPEYLFEKLNTLRDNFKHVNVP